MDNERDTSPGRVFRQENKAAAVFQQRVAAYAFLGAQLHRCLVKGIVDSTGFRSTRIDRYNFYVSE